MKIKVLIVLAILIAIANCGKKPEVQKALVKGNITVADSIDATGDYSGIELLITYRDNSTEELDTLFQSRTDITGSFEGEIEFPFQGIYPLLISRNGERLFLSQLILADNDTISIRGELPGLNTNFEVDSRENRAMEVFNRIDRNFQRVLTFINAGQVADSLVDDEVLKWSGIYWEVKENNEGTFASNLAARQSVSLLKGFDNELMMNRLDTALINDFMISFAASFGKTHIAETRGIEPAIRYLDSLKQLTKEETIIQAIEKEKIVFYYDSAEVNKAKELLARFEKKYADDTRAMDWAKNIGYDLSYLAPGYRVPAFEFVTQEGDTINAESMLGRPYLLEITPVANQLYQEQYDRTVVIHQLYQNYDLQVFTIALDKSEITINAFFEERAKYWPVAEYGSFDIQGLIEKFNITRIPTRILVDQKGTIVKKYVGDDFDDVINGLNKIITIANQES